MTGAAKTSASEKAMSAMPMSRIARSDANTPKRGRATCSSFCSQGTARSAARATSPRDRLRSRSFCGSQGWGRPTKI